MRRFLYAPKLFAEFWRFARANKIYWIVPLILLLALTISLIVVSQSAAPFLYTFF